MTDREIVTEYRQNVVALSSIMQQLAWKQRHNLPVLNLPDRLLELKKDVLRFEDILQEIPNRRTQILLRCRYALGMKVHDTADFLDMSCGSVTRLTHTALDRLH